MQKAIEDLVQQYSALKPKLVWKVAPSTKEKIVIDYAGGILQVAANEERNLYFALHQAMIGLKSGHIGEYLGWANPRFALRAVQLDQVDETACRKLAMLGFNAAIVPNREALPLLRSYGLKGFCKNGEFWESGLLSPDFLDDAPDLTLVEKVYQEMRHIEKGDVILYIPAHDLAGAKRQSEWFADLLDAVGRLTSVAFPAKVGQALHPLWGHLRKTKEISGTPLLPLLDFGKDLSDILPRLKRHPFAGAIGSAAVSDCELWIAGQALWHGQSPALSAETWELACL
jgi:hypothetical protein